MTTLLPLSPVGGAITRAVQLGTGKMEAGLLRATAFGDKEKGQENLQSGLMKALANIEDLEHPLELHLITNLSVSVIDLLFTRLKARLGRLPSLRPVNLLSPQPQQRRPAEPVSGSTLFNRKFFTDELDLDARLRAALLCQPGAEPHLILHLSQTDRISLDLQLRSVVPAAPLPVNKKKKQKEPSTFGPEDLAVEATVTTSGLYCFV